MKIPKIRTDLNGRLYFILRGKRIFIEKDISERQLIKFIIKHLTNTNVPKTNILLRRKASTRKTIKTRMLSQAKPKPKTKMGMYENDGKAPTSSASILPSFSGVVLPPVPVVSIDPRSNPSVAEKILEQQLRIGNLPAVIPPVSQPKLQILPSELLALAPAEMSDDDKKKFVDKYFKDVYKLSLPEAKAHFDELRNQIATHEKDKVITSDQLKKSQIDKLRNDFLTSKTQVQLQTLVKDNKISPPSGTYLSKTSKEDLLKLLELHHAIDFNQIWTDKHKTKLPIKMKQAGNGTPSSQSKSKHRYDPKKGLSTDEINQIMSQYPHFSGTYASDQILSAPIKTKTEFGIVINKDKINQCGSHWVALYSNGHSTLEYFDSFGNNPTPTLLKDLKIIAKKIGAEDYLQLKINKIIQQEDQTTNCGFFSCKFLIDRFKGKPFRESTKYDDSIKGEKNIEEFKRKLHIKPFKYISSFTQDGKGLKEIYEGIKKGLKYVGSKLLDIIRNGSHRMNFSPLVRRILERFGNEKIIEIKLVRVPIKAVISKILNWVTLGKFNQNLNELGYDNALHLFMLIKLSDGTIIKVEKNEVIDTAIAHNFNPEGESISVGSPNNTLNEFLDKGLKSVGEQKYFIYDSKRANCQIFLADNLKANGLWSQSVSNWVLQDAEKIYEGLGLLEMANKAITDTASKLNHALLGSGKRKIKLNLRNH